ncbi:MAG TPA: HD domain-containing protein [Burkholderiaceae bacterium]
MHHWQAQLQAIAAKHAGDDGAHDATHVQRVWRTAQALLAAHPNADVLVVQAACFLHDIVNLPKDHPQRAQASQLAAGAATRELARIGFPPEKLPAVAHAIAAHSFSAAIAPETIEAQIVQDADRLDALGAVGLARLFYTAGKMDSSLAHAGDALAQSRPLDDKAYALDHIAAKLETLPASMQTEAGRKLGEERLRLIHAFRAQFAAEWTGSV